MKKSKQLHLALVWFLLPSFALAQGGGSSTIGIQQVPPPAFDVRINEVLFDPVGAAGLEGTYSFVELYFNQATSTNGMVLLNSDDSVQIPLPLVFMPSGSYLVVFFGPNDTDLQNLDPNLGPVSITTGQPWGDYLGVTQGGVKLKKGSAVVDEIYWGV